MKAWMVATLFSLLLISGCDTTYKTQKSSSISTANILQNDNATSQLQGVIIPLPPQKVPENPHEETQK